MRGQDRRHRPDPRRELLEDRLRTALAARAHTVDLHELRRPSPPSASARTRFPVRGAALALFGLAAVLACVLLLLPEEHRREQPAPPANPPVSHSAPPAPRVTAPAPPSTVPGPSQAPGVTAPAAQGPADQGAPAAGPPDAAHPEAP
jgi:hypothetical protein